MLIRGRSRTAAKISRAIARTAGSVGSTRSSSSTSGRAAMSELQDVVGPDRQAGLERAVGGEPGQQRQRAVAVGGGPAERVVHLLPAEDVGEHPLIAAAVAAAGVGQVEVLGLLPVPAQGEPGAVVGLGPQLGARPAVQRLAL